MTNLRSPPLPMSTGVLRLRNSTSNQSYSKSAISPQPRRSQGQYHHSGYDSGSAESDSSLALSIEERALLENGESFLACARPVCVNCGYPVDVVNTMLILLPIVAGEHPKLAEQYQVAAELSRGLGGSTAAPSV